MQLFLVILGLVVHFLFVSPAQTVQASALEFRASLVFAVIGNVWSMLMGLERSLYNRDIVGWWSMSK